MLNRYLMQAPTMIVIGVSGYAAWPALFPEQKTNPPKASAKPPASAQAAPSIVGPTDRDPFQVSQPPVSKAVLAATSTSPAAVAAQKVATSAALAERSATDDDVLGGMRLGGTFIDGREQIAIIDNKVYALGDHLRKADGSALPYTITAVRKDRAVLRRGQRDFVLAFSDVPRLGVPKAGAPVLAKASTPPPAQAPPSPKTETVVRRDDTFRSRRTTREATDPSTMISQLLSLLGGGSSSGAIGGGSSSGAIGGLGLGNAANPNAGSSAAGLSITPATISAGLDALRGAYDNIGRDSATGGATP